MRAISLALNIAQFTWDPVQILTSILGNEQIPANVHAMPADAGVRLGLQRHSRLKHDLASHHLVFPQVLVPLDPVILGRLLLTSLTSSKGFTLWMEGVSRQNPAFLTGASIVSHKSRHVIPGRATETQISYDSFARRGALAVLRPYVPDPNRHLRLRFHVAGLEDKLA